MGDMYEYEDMTLEELSERFGKTKGIAIYMACRAVNILFDSSYSTWEDVADEFYDVLVNYIDE